MATRSTTTTRKPKTTKVEEPKAEPTGRTVANMAQPARQGFSLSLSQWASANGWTVKDVSDPSPEIVHIYAKDASQQRGGAVLTHKDGPVLRVSFFATKDGSSDRLDAAYLWLPGATSGRRVQTVYQVKATMEDAGKAVAAVDPTRKRAVATTEPEVTAAEPEKAPATKTRSRAKKAS